MLGGNLRLLTSWTSIPFILPLGNTCAEMLERRRVRSRGPAPCKRVCLCFSYHIPCHMTRLSSLHPRSSVLLCMTQTLDCAMCEPLRSSVRCRKEVARISATLVCGAAGMAVAPCCRQYLSLQCTWIVTRPQAPQSAAMRSSSVMSQSNLQIGHFEESDVIKSVLSQAKAETDPAELR